MTGKRNNRLQRVIGQYRQPEEEVWYPYGPDPCFDFSLHAGRHIRLIKVRYPRTHLQEPRDVAKKYWKDIAAFRTFGFSEMVSKEMVLKEPGPIWRRFRVLPETVEEVLYES
jgi:hypothetical protein